MNIFKAATKGDLGIALTFIKEGKIDINHTDENGRTVLHYAALTGNLEMVKTLIKFNAKIDAKDNYNITPLWLTTIFCHTNVVIELLKYGANPNSKNQMGNSILHIAASNNSLAIVKLLIEYGGDVNAVNNFNWSVLHSAAFGIIIETETNWEVIEYLLKHNVNILVKDQDNNSVRDIFHQEDYSYIKHYDNLVKELWESNGKKISFSKIEFRSVR